MIDLKTKENFYKILDEMENPQGIFLAADLESVDFKINLKYPRENFINDIEHSLATYPKAKQTDITSFYGFVIEHNDESLPTIKGYPSVTNLQKEDLSSASTRVFHYVQNFIEDNEITVENNPQLTKYLNVIIKAFPEFLTLIGKAQHKTHSYSVDIHTLKVLQGVMQHPKYQSLPDIDRRVLQIAVLMHDITKKEGIIDKSHPACAAKDASFILNKFDLSQELKNRICLIIKNHDWLERYNKGITSAREFANILKDGNNFLMLSIMAEADLKAVQRGDVFFDKYKSVLFEGFEEINTLINTPVSAA